MVGTNNPEAKALGVLLELISGFSVIAIAVLMFPLLKPFGRRMAVGYFCLKGVEGGIMLITAMLFLIHSAPLLMLRDQLYLIHGYIFAVPAILFYILLYRSKLVPEWLSIWGIVACVLLMIVNVFEFMNVDFLGRNALYLPIVLNELVLALLLIFKGFDFPLSHISTSPIKKG